MINCGIFINGILLRKEEAKYITQNINEPLKHYAEQIKSGAKEYMLYDSIRMKVRNKQN